ncbi:MAG: hypothetical protein LBQ89_07745 [Treponema sp.]|jgi:glycosyltransferase involved in cell wall biosynthesis|nr:hypothetical protein [Treponema sp.]
MGIESLYGFIIASVIIVLMILFFYKKDIYGPVENKKKKYPYESAKYKKALFHYAKYAYGMNESLLNGLSFDSLEDFLLGQTGSREKLFEEAMKYYEPGWKQIKEE